MSYNAKALAFFIFRSWWIDYDYDDLATKKGILADAFAGRPEWRVPELVDAAVQDPQLHFDSESQIEMPGWHNGRIDLVGDAAYCASTLSGRGTSLALTVPGSSRRPCASIATGLARRGSNTNAISDPRLPLPGDRSTGWRAPAPRHPGPDRHAQPGNGGQGRG